MYNLIIIMLHQTNETMYRLSKKVYYLQEFCRQFNKCCVNCKIVFNSRFLFFMFFLLFCLNASRQKCYLGLFKGFESFAGTTFIKADTDLSLWKMLRACTIINE